MSTKTKTLKKSKKMSEINIANTLLAFNESSKKTIIIEEPSNDFCVGCNSVNLISDDGFPTCSNKNCGIINSYAIDYSPEWRFSTEDRHATNPARCGNPVDPLLTESSYACKVMCGSGSSTEMKNIRKWTKWQSMPPKEKALYDEFLIISNTAANAGIPKIIIDYAKCVYKQFYDQQTFRGINREATRAGAIWIACWTNDCPRSANEIAEIFKIDKNSASTGCTLAENMLLNSERILFDADKSKLCTILPSVFIERFANKLKYAKEHVMLSMFIATQIEKRELIQDNRPQAIAVGILYFVSIYCVLNISKQQIVQILDNEVSEVTVNKCFHKLEKIYLTSKLLPPSVISKFIKKI